MTVWVERFAPLAIGLAVGGIGFQGRDLLLSRPDRVAQLGSVTVAVGSIAIGFLGNACAVLLSMESVGAVVELKRSGHWSSLIGYLKGAVNLTLAFVAASAWVALLDVADGGPVVVGALCLWLLLGGWSAAATYRILHLFWMLLQNSSKPAPSTPPKPLPENPPEDPTP